MLDQTVSISISRETLAAAQRLAAMENVSVSALLDSLVQRHAEYIDTLNSLSHMSKFSLGESDEDFEKRRDLFS